MIVRKKKECKNCGKEDYIFGYGMCKPCYTKTRVHKPSKIVKIKPISKKQSSRNNDYLKLRKQYFNEHLICECCQVRPPTEIHHKRGRIGSNLFEHFLAVCSDCHRKIEENPEWAKENGFSEGRL